jgi:arsenite methyltransferase
MKGAVQMSNVVREEVRERYAGAATSLSAGCGCGCDCESNGCCGTEATTKFGQGLYPATEREGLPETAVAASLGCGNPLALVELRKGETVLDLGSGGGIDVLLSARRVGPEGTVYGLDMTEEMLALARENARKAGATNVHFLQGLIEDVPLAAESVDVVISNCVVNLSPEKERVLSEIARVLRPGGRIGISDVVAEDRLTPADRAERGSHVGCIAGALSISEYRDGLAAAGLVEVDVELTHAVTDGMHGAIVRASKPSAAFG